MGKKIKIQTRSLGSEPDPCPDLGEVVQWLRTRKGVGADLTGYRLYSTLVPQVSASVEIPCTGGNFYQSRILETIRGIKEMTIIGEPGLEMAFVERDVCDIVAGFGRHWFAMPALCSLGIRDGYYGDDEEFSGVMLQVYRRLMREMRDFGVTGHILIVESPDEEELAVLAGRKTMFFYRYPTREDLESLLEYQRTIAVPGDALEVALSLKEEYTIDRLLLIDPVPGDLEIALSHWDPDSLSVAGYCDVCGEGYWNTLVEGASNVILPD